MQVPILLLEKVCGVVQLGQKGRPFTTRLPYFMENVTTKSFGVGLERTFIGGFGLDSSLVDSDSTQVWWTRTRLEFGGLGLDSSIFKWTRTRLESQSQMTRTRLESFNGWTRSNTAIWYCMVGVSEKEQKLDLKAIF